MMLITYKLDYNKATTVFSGEKDFASVGQFNIFSDLDLTLGLLGDVPHVGEATVDEYPLAVVEMEVADGFLVFGLGSFVGSDEPIDMPHVERLLVVDHQAVVFGQELAFGRRVVEVQHGQLAVILGAAERTFRLCRIVEYKPVSFAIWILTGLH